ncbi:U1 snRNP-associated protein Usp103 [Schizosaccharomyces octosporus yFS286]|uniref:U1 snRNP-associated protein Usp103 n=1 Tax=Schizosaccharomyces octosporus (strain yFS286) TaxID=483514 RepID=S9Q2J7_SCHOY|nr:U1 snRNP-associated protein Usp103 [Schizosaccharomyces octosporus yFS286]EPX74322.1 U1 snRNP-associated protein Usp103 [Schizosaccharomyces octosporus yFS286]
MPKYLCDYCQVWLTHDSQSVRKAHNAGRAHLQNVQDYYTKVAQEEAQKRLEEDPSLGNLNKESSLLQLPLAYAFPPKLYQFQFTYPPPPNIVPANVYMATRGSVPTATPMPYIPTTTTTAFNPSYSNGMTTVMPVTNPAPDAGVAHSYSNSAQRSRTQNIPNMTGKQHPYQQKKQFHARSSRT